MANTTKLYKTSLLLKGQLYEVDIEKSPFPFSKLSFNKTNISLTLSSCICPDKHTEFIKNKIFSWLKSQARTSFLTITNNICKKYQLNFSQIRIKDTKSRWGSCSSNKNLNFNWRLIMAPETVIYYIAVHETAHLTELNHSHRFWKIVSERCPNYIENELWLKNNGAKLLSWVPVLT